MGGVLAPPDFADIEKRTEGQTDDLLSIVPPPPHRFLEPATALHSLTLCFETYTFGKWPILIAISK